MCLETCLCLEIWSRGGVDLLIGGAQWTVVMWLLETSKKESQVSCMRPRSDRSWSDWASLIFESWLPCLDMWVWPHSGECFGYDAVEPEGPKQVSELPHRRLQAFCDQVNLWPCISLWHRYFVTATENGWIVWSWGPLLLCPRFCLRQASRSLKMMKQSWNPTWHRGVRLAGCSFWQGTVYRDHWCFKTPLQFPTC